MNNLGQEKKVRDSVARFFQLQQHAISISRAIHHVHFTSSAHQHDNALAQCRNLGREQWSAHVRPVPNLWRCADAVECICCSSILAPQHQRADSPLEELVFALKCHLKLNLQRLFIVAVERCVLDWDKRRRTSMFCNTIGAQHPLVAPSANLK